MIYRHCTAAFAAALCFAAVACSGPEDAERQTADAAPAPVLEEPAFAPAEEPVAAEAEEDAEELARREAEIAAAEADLAQREELARREAEIADREAELARRERAAAAPTTPPPAAPPVVEPEPAPALVEPEPGPTPVRERVDVLVPQGTLVDVEFRDGLSSATSQVGQTFTTRVASDVLVDGLVAIPAGSVVTGVVTEAVPLRRIGGRARLGVEFDRLVLSDGSESPIVAGFAEAGRSETGKDAATIGGAAAAGAILGRATASRDDRKKATIIGTILGAAAGTVIAAKTDGEEITIPEGTFVTLQLDAPVTVTAER